MDETRTHDVDAVVVGAGFAAGTRSTGCGTRTLPSASSRRVNSVGGTWYWNRYPGARCDVREHGVLLLLLRRAAAGVGVDGTVRHPAGDPALPEPRRRPLRAAFRYPAADHGWSPPITTRTPRGGPSGCTTGVDGHRPLRDHGERVSLGPSVPSFPGRAFPGGRTTPATGQPMASTSAGCASASSAPARPASRSYPWSRRRQPRRSSSSERPTSRCRRNAPLTVEKIAAIKADYAKLREQARWSGNGTLRVKLRRAGRAPELIQQRYEGRLGVRRQNDIVG